MLILPVWLFNRGILMLCHQEVFMASLGSKITL
jgi:hypothetical protein